MNSDSAWVTPQVEVANQRVVLHFTTSALTNSTYTATISATHGANTDTVFVNATLGVRNIFKLMDDPVRSRMYGIQLNGVNRGAIAVIDPLTGASISSVTVGNRPTGMAVSNDGSELFVINAVDETVSVVNLDNLTVKQTLLLPTFDNWGTANTTANIGVGPGTFSITRTVPGLLCYVCTTGPQALSCRPSTLTARARVLDSETLLLMRRRLSFWLGAVWLVCRFIELLHR